MGFSIICFPFADVHNSIEVFNKIQNQEQLKALTKHWEFGLLLLSTLSCDCVWGYNDRWVGGNKEDWLRAHLRIAYSAKTEIFFAESTIDKAKMQLKYYSRIYEQYQKVQ